MGMCAVVLSVSVATSAGALPEAVCEELSDEAQIEGCAASVGGAFLQTAGIDGMPASRRDAKSSDSLRTGPDGVWRYKYPNYPGARPLDFPTADVESSGYELSKRDHDVFYNDDSLEDPHADSRVHNPAGRDIHSR